MGSHNTSRPTHYTLTWNGFSDHVATAFEELRAEDDLTDVTLSCSGMILRAHKVLLCACSPYFRQIFKDNPCKHPTIIIKNVEYSELKALILFIYTGKANVRQEDLQIFLETAKLFQVKGLADIDESGPQHLSHPLLSSSAIPNLIPPAYVGQSSTVKSVMYSNQPSNPENCRSKSSSQYVQDFELDQSSLKGSETIRKSKRARLDFSGVCNVETIDISGNEVPLAQDGSSKSHLNQPQIRAKNNNTFSPAPESTTNNNNNNINIGDESNSHKSKRMLDNNAANININSEPNSFIVSAVNINAKSPSQEKLLHDKSPSVLKNALQNNKQKRPNNNFLNYGNNNNSMNSFKIKDLPSSNIGTTDNNKQVNLSPILGIKQEQQNSNVDKQQQQQLQQKQCSNRPKSLPSQGKASNGSSNDIVEVTCRTVQPTKLIIENKNIYKKSSSACSSSSGGSSSNSNSECDAAANCTYEKKDVEMNGPEENHIDVVLCEDENVEEKEVFMSQLNLFRNPSSSAASLDSVKSNNNSIGSRNNTNKPALNQTPFEKQQQQQPPPLQLNFKNYTYTSSTSTPPLNQQLMKQLLKNSPNSKIEKTSTSPAHPNVPMNLSVNQIPSRLHNNGSGGRKLNASRSKRDALNPAESSSPSMSSPVVNGNNINSSKRRFISSSSSSSTSDSSTPIKFNTQHPQLTQKNADMGENELDSLREDFMKNAGQFVCTECGKRYVHQRSLNDHMKSHMGQTRCPCCNKLFSKVANMRSHVHAQHPNFSLTV